MYRMDHLQAFIKESRSGFKVKETRSGINHNRQGQYSKAYLIPFIYLDEVCFMKIPSPITIEIPHDPVIDPGENKDFAGLQMSKKGRKPTFVHTVVGEKTLVGEFHYGSAPDPNVLAPGKGIKLFLTDPPYNLGFDYGEVSDKRPEEEYHQMMEDIFDSCYEAADDDAHLFIIHYPQDLAKMWPRLTKKWKFHQWIN